VRAGTEPIAGTVGNPLVVTLGRVGLAGYGVVNLLLAWLTVRVAFGASEAEAEAGKGGAVQHIAETGWGAGLLWVIGIGLLALAIWQLAEAVRRHGSQTGVTPRLVSAAEAVAFVVLGISAVRAAAGRGSGGSNEEQADFTARVLGTPGGPVIVGAAGVLLVAVAALLAAKGLTRRFLDDLDLRRASAGTRAAVGGLGTVGYLTLGVAYGIVGGLIVAAAAEHDPEKATGLDTALGGLTEHRYGTGLLLVIALGFACFGAFCFLDARFRTT
jgi:uncharacterized membrane protein YidH (DUF202 family)